MSGRRSPHAPGLAVGAAILALGTLLVLDTGGAFDLGFAYIGPALLAAVGVVLLVSGVWSRRGR